jgi:allophanate hydrolase
MRAAQHAAMPEARLAIVSCGPLVSFQDGGRFGMMRFGVPASGPMDRLAHAAAGAALGQPAGGTAIEISMGGLTLVCESGEVTCCIAGGEFQVVHAGAASRSWCVRTLRAGDELVVRAGRWGSWTYLAFAGELECNRWAGSTSTHLASGLGGGTLTPGLRLRVDDARVLHEREGSLPVPDWAGPRQRARVVLGPQTQHFSADATAALLQNRFTVTSACDRMGMKLRGPELTLRDVLSIPSEPVVRGSIQVAGDGVASILLADHQTTGGYPKIATLLSSDIDGVAQLRPQADLTFEAVDAQQAIRLVRTQAQLRHRFLREIAGPGGLLNDRLMRENLISGFVSDPP